MVEVADDEVVAIARHAVVLEICVRGGDKIGPRLDAGDVRCTGIERRQRPSSVMARQIEHAGPGNAARVRFDNGEVAQR